MAKYSDLKEIRGSIDDLVFYNLNGIPIVRKKSGFNKNDFENNPKYAKVRENSSEFGHCSKSGKLIRMEIQNYTGDCEDKYLYQKFAKLMTQIKDMDTQNPKGKRRIETGMKKPEALSLLKDFPFGKFGLVSDVVSEGNAMFTKNILLNKKIPVHSAELLTLKPNLEKQTIESCSQILKINKNLSLDFDFQFDENDFLLYFLILKKENEILYAGFV